MRPAANLLLLRETPQSSQTIAQFAVRLLQSQGADPILAFFLKFFDKTSNIYLIRRAHSKSVLRLHGMEEGRVRFPVGPQRHAKPGDRGVPPRISNKKSL